MLVRKECHMGDEGFDFTLAGGGARSRATFQPTSLPVLVFSWLCSPCRDRAPQSGTHAGPEQKKLSYPSGTNSQHGKRSHS